MSNTHNSLNVSYESLKECISWLDDAMNYAYCSREIDHDQREMMQDTYFALKSIQSTLYCLVRDVK